MATDYNFSISDIMNMDDNCKDKRILSEPKINTGVVGVIEDYASDMIGYVDNTKGYLFSIEGSLKTTNSNQFFYGDEARAQYNVLNDTMVDLVHSRNYATMLQLCSDDIEKVVDSFNEKLVSLKKVTRLNLLKDAIDGINAQNILVSGPKYSREEFFDFPNSPVITYEKGLYKVVKTYTYLEDDTVCGMMVYQCEKSKYVFIQYSNTSTYAELEQKITEVGQSLPYSNSDLVDFE